MTLVIKSDLVITNPKLGKLKVKKIIASCSLLRTGFGDIVGTTTDSFQGGYPSVWSGAAVMEYVEGGVANSNNTIANTAYLNTELFKDCEVGFEVVSLSAGGQLIVDLRRLTSGDNYCVRVTFGGTGQVYIANRYSEGSPYIQGVLRCKAGDKFNIRLVGNSVQMRINDVLVSDVTITPEAQSQLDREGVFALSKSSTASGQVVIKNLVISKTS